MNEIFIRKVEEKDIEDIVDIQIKGWQSAYRGIIEDEYLDSMNKEEKIVQRKKDYNQNGFIVSIQNNEIVGFCRYIDNNKFSEDIKEADCEIMAIYVKPDKKQNGIGRKMFEYVISYFKSINKKKMILWCLKENYESRRFYEKMGGIIVGEHSINLAEKDYLEVGFSYNIN